MPGPVSKEQDELSQLLNRNRLSEAMSDHLLKLGIESLSDFVGLVDSQSYESELKTLIVDKSACKDDLVQLSRVRNAWKEAHMTVEKSRKRRIEVLLMIAMTPLILVHKRPCSKPSTRCTG